MRRLISCAGNALLALVSGLLGLYALYAAFAYLFDAANGGAADFSPWYLSLYSTLWFAASGICLAGALFFLCRSWHHLIRGGSDPAPVGPGTAGYDEIDLTIPVEQLERFMRKVSLPTLLVVWIPYMLVHGFPGVPSPKQLAVFLVLIVPVYLLSICLHELLHALGFWVLSGVPSHRIHFGIMIRPLAAYASTQETMYVRPGRVAIALPGVVLGVLPAVVGLLIGSPWVALYGWIMLASAGGDLAYLSALRGVSPVALMCDADQALGCKLLVPSIGEPAELPVQAQQSGARHA